MGLWCRMIEESLDRGTSLALKADSGVLLCKTDTIKCLLQIVHVWKRSSQVYVNGIGSLHTDSHPPLNFHLAYVSIIFGLTEFMIWLPFPSKKTCDLTTTVKVLITAPKKLIQNHIWRSTRMFKNYLRHQFSYLWLYFVLQLERK